MTAADDNNKHKQAAAIKAAAAAAAAQAAPRRALEPNDVPVAQQLRWYYARLFPLPLLARWLRVGDARLPLARPMAHRELAMTLAPDVFVRWQSFGDEHALRRELAARAPLKLDIGAVYNEPPSERHKLRPAALAPLLKELVFDIDMTDYAPVLPPAADALPPTELCDRFWPYMALAVRVVHDALRLDFGFRHVLWLYSGRRGVHCWVADARARRLSNEQRAALADYVQLRLQPHAAAAAALAPPLHPALARARAHCDALFARVLREQRPLHDAAAAARLLAPVRSARVRAAIVARLPAQPPEPAARWAFVRRELRRAARADAALRGADLLVVMAATFPRLDVAVSRDVRHLLKAPFCVHPASRRVCVPFRADHAHAFEPARMAPTLHALLRAHRRGGGGGGAAEADAEAGAAAEAEAAAAAGAEAEAEGGRDALRHFEHAVRELQRFVLGCEQQQRDAQRDARLRRVDERAARQLLAQ